jgi:L-fucose isomerase-like protein
VVSRTTVLEERAVKPSCKPGSSVVNVYFTCPAISALSGAPDDPLDTFGGAGVVEIPGLQKLLHYICENGFEHHVAANFSSVAPAVHEAASRYLGWEMYAHAG